MRKLFAILALVALMIPAFADDALVLPAGVLRTYVTSAYAFGDQAFDADGETVDAAYELNALNLGFALEYGVNDFISAGLQWAPGWNVWSKTDATYGPLAGLFTGDILANGIFDLFVGAKIQVVGPNAPVQNESIRFAVTPGLKIPMPLPNWEDQIENIVADEPAYFNKLDKHAWALGGRLSFDYLLNESFYFNLFGEYIQYLEATDVEEIQLGVTPTVVKNDYVYGYSLKLEAEAHYDIAMANNAKLSFGLPVTYEMWPETEKNGAAVANSDGYSLELAPSASYFFLAGKLPFEVKLGYGLPLMGKNVGNVLNSVVFQLKSYLKF